MNAAQSNLITNLRGGYDMANEVSFYKCDVCGNIVERVVKAGGSLSCCGQDMVLLDANSTDAAGEKHVPVVEVLGNKVEVKVGSVEHPMTSEHSIKFIVLVTEKTVQRVDLLPSDKPVAEFALLDGDEVIAAYEYCNLHGLWIAEV